MLTLTDSTVSDHVGLCGAIHNEGTAMLTNSTVSGNRYGPGIVNFGTATLMDSTVSGNMAPGFGGASGIANEGTLTLTNSTVSGNMAGPGIVNFFGTATVTNSTVSGNEGSGIANEGTLMLTNSTVSDNTGTGINGAGTLTLMNSTVSGNLVGISASLLTLTNSTVSRNEVGMTVFGETRVINSTVSANNGEICWQSGECFGGGIRIDDGEASFINSTVSDNGGDTYASIYVGLYDYRPVNIRLANTLVDGECSVWEESSITSVGHNIESPGDTCGFDQPTDQIEVTAERLNLGPLQDNGGPTMTHALLTEPAISVAIDAIPAEDCVDADEQPLTGDQRGEPRPETGGTMCDVGAFELQP
jgi:hypothetical protein